MSHLSNPDNITTSPDGKEPPTLFPASIMTRRLSYWVLLFLLLMHLLRLSNQSHTIFFPLQLLMQLLIQYLI